jgi:hypothetical protein
MNERAEYFLQTIERIGAPLMAAITETSKVSGAKGAAADAQAMAMMLSKVVQASIDLGQAMDVNPVEVGDDSLRVALAGLASPLVAGQMRKKGEVPEDAEVARIVSALQAVLTFSDNFTPNTDNAQRLKDIEARGQSVDAHQASVQYVQAFVPVVQAISDFSFGQVPQKLIVDVSERLVKRAAEMRETLVPAAEGDEQKRIELGFLGGLTHIYAACHAAETRKASGMGEEGGAGPSLDSVWAAFDTQAAMLELLSASFVPGGNKAAAGVVSSGGGVAPVAQASAPPVVQAPEAPQAPPPVQPPVAPPVTPPPVTPPPADAAAQGASPLSSFVKKPVAEVAAAPPPVAPPPVAASPAETVQNAPLAGGNPMSMFAKPKADGAPADAVAPPPVAQAPVAPPPVQPPAEAPPVAPPAAPPTAPPAEGQASGESGEGAQSGGGPMSFFKKEE